MKRKYFSETDLGILLAPEKWRIVSGCLKPEEKPVRDKKHAGWMRSNQQAHNTTEIMLVLSGAAKFGYGGKIYPCRPGTLFLINPSTQHDYMYPPFCPDVRHLWIGISDSSALATVFKIERGQVSTPFKMLLDNVPFLHFFINELAIVSADHNKMPDRVRRASLLPLLSLLMTQIVRVKTLGDGSETREYRKEIIRVVARNILSAGGRGFRLENTAKFAGFSRFHFHRLFKKETGFTFHEYVDQCRSKKIDELRKTGKNKSQIADELGFSSLSVLSRWMKKMD